MKKLSVLFLAVAFVISSAVNASTGSAKTKSVLNKEIKTLLKNPSFKIEKELTAYVTFILNDDNEIVVLSVASESEVLEGFIKSRLNYQKMNFQKDADIKVYKLPVRLVEE